MDSPSVADGASGLAAPGDMGRVSSVVAVIVTYRPAAARLGALLRALDGQVAQVVIVDNGSAPWPLPACALPLRVLRHPRNIGLAAAQNDGLRLACAQGASHVLLLDQDSRPAPGMVAALLEAWRQAHESGLAVAAVGPCVVDPRGVCDGFVRFDQGRYRTVPVSPGQAWQACDMLIASGCLIPRDMLDRVGLMSDALFIDKIDTEWSLRAKSLGLQLLGVPGARLDHCLGDRHVRLWFGRWRELPLHQPFRYYYMVRNSLLLQRLPHAHDAWRRADRRQLLSLLLYFGVLAPGRGRALLMMLRGLWDGWRRRGGPLGHWRQNPRDLLSRP